jgi:enoyl-CoA hydratase/carnithine racemase
MTERVLIDVQDHVAHVRLNRPEKHNGLDPQMFDAVIAAGERLLAERCVRAVVLSGEGPSFCAGLDFQAFMAGGPALQSKLIDERVGPANLAQRVAWIWQELPAPVIAAVHGAAYGGGLQIALGADIRYVAPDARLSVMEIKWGLIPDMGITKTLLRVARPDVARELTFTGRTVSGAEAAALGLATRVCADPLAAALETARQIAGRNPDAVRRSKRLFIDAEELDVAGAFLRETDLQREILGSANQLEAVVANLQKRTPEFRDPG